MDSSDEDDVIIGSASFLVLMLEKLAQKRSRSVHVNPYLLERKEKGRFGIDVSKVIRI